MAHLHALSRSGRAGPRLVCNPSTRMWTRDEDAGDETYALLGGSYGTYPRAPPDPPKPRLRCPSCCKVYGPLIALLLLELTFLFLLYVSNSPEALIGFVLVTWVLSLCLHEFAHSLTAFWLGDTSMRDSGYLSCDVFAYSNFCMSVLVPVAFLYLGGLALPGGAVYIKQSALRSPTAKSLVSLAGPAANLLCLLVMALPFFLHEGDYPTVVEPALSSSASSSPSSSPSSSSFSSPSSSSSSPYSALETGVRANDVTSLSQQDMQAHTRLWQGLAVSVFFQFSALILNLLPFPPLDGFGIMLPWLPTSLKQWLLVEPKMWFLSLASFFFILVLFYGLQLNSLLLTVLDSCGVPRSLGATGLHTFLTPLSEHHKQMVIQQQSQENYTAASDPFGGLGFTEMVEMVPPGR
eukprot:g525.t1